MSVTLDRAALLRELGYGHPEAERRAVEVLVDAGLTNPRKTGIAAEKRDRAREALETALVRLCARCRERPPADEREPVPARDAGTCEGCGGSANRRAVERAAAACRRRGVRRIVVVGGSPGVHAGLRALWPADLELRIVSGTDRMEGRRARADLRWGDVVLVWGTSELDHKVSVHYTNARSPKVVTAHRRSIEALADRLVEHLGG